MDWIQMSRGCREILGGAGVAGSKECAERDREAEEGAMGEPRRQGWTRRETLSR